MIVTSIIKELKEDYEKDVQIPKIYCSVFSSFELNTDIRRVNGHFQLGYEKKHGPEKPYLQTLFR